jgi:hypothetical protein
MATLTTTQVETLFGESESIEARPKVLDTLETSSLAGYIDEACRYD